MRYKIAMAIAIACMSALLVYAGEEAIIRQLVSKKQARKLITSSKPVKPVRCTSDLPDAIAKPIVWTVENAVKHDGWQLTGYSSLKIQDEGISRWKIGIINPELETMQDFSEFERWQDQLHRNRNEGIVFGIHFIKTF